MKRLISIVCALMMGVYFFGGSCDEIKGPERKNQPPEVRFVNIPVEDAKVSSIITLYWQGTDIDGFIKYYRYCVVRKDTIDTYADSVSGLPAPINYINSRPMDDFDWTVIEVTPNNPGTSADINMAADETDPVRNYLTSYVFLQAIDDKGALSVIDTTTPDTYKFFQKNNHFPNTKIVINNILNPYVNVDTNLLATAALQGVPIGWYAVDSADYLEPPPFQYKWKLLGPYSDAEMAEINKKYTGRVFQDLYGDYYFEDDNYPINDSVSVPLSSLSGPYGSWEDIFYLDTIYDTIAPIVSTYLPIPAAMIRVVDSSGANGENPWGYGMNKRFGNIYDNSIYPVDTTSQYNFIFWCQARDDAEVPDKVPAFGWISIIEPKFEREVIVLDQTHYFRTDIAYNWPLFPRKPFTDYNDGGPMQNSMVKDVYARMINNWAGSEVFDTTVLEDKFIPKADGTICKMYYSRGLTSQDYYPIQNMTRNMPGCSSEDEIVSLREILKHKIVILIKDDIGKELFLYGSVDDHPELISMINGLNAGMSCLSMIRSPYKGYGQDPASWQELLGQAYRSYFGVQQMRYTGWLGALRDTSSQGSRIEDFVGANPVSGVARSFPSLPVDTLLLENRYIWCDVCDLFNPKNISSDCDTFPPYLYSWYKVPFRCGYTGEMLTGALPEVGFVQKSGSDHVKALYVLESLYGPDSGQTQAPPPSFDDAVPWCNSYTRVGNKEVYDGKVVAVYTNASPYFKTAHFSFTFLPIAEDSAQAAFNSIMDSLAAGQYFRDGFGGSGKVSSFGFPTGKSSVNVTQLKNISSQLNEARERQLRENKPRISVDD